MTVLVDEAVWPWRGRRWAHLVSDESYRELHEAARRIGSRRLGFQGDHYDIDAVDRVRALSEGALAVDSRELIRRLRSAGLRHPGAKPSWVRMAEWPVGEALDGVEAALALHGRSGRRLSAALSSFDGRLTGVGVALFSDEQRLVALLEFDSLPTESVSRLAMETTDLVDEVVVGEPRVGGDRSIELFVSVRECS